MWKVEPMPTPTYIINVLGVIFHDLVLHNECLEKTVPHGMCAVLYDDDGCEGWEHAIREGYTELTWWYRNDAEAVIADRGERLLMDARNFFKPYNMWKNLDRNSLVDDISSIECECFGDKELNEQRREERRAIDPGSNIESSKCPPMPRHACAVLFDEENCRNDDWDNSIVLADGEDRSFSLFNSMMNFKYKNEVESFMVREGCIFEAYDDSDYSDDGIRVRALNGDLLINLNSHRNDKYESLNNDIESVRCFCAS
ncbi:unnamed protein product [Lepeophtheirus salmonis]|uniref:(salmon louse) hypothetical protein n=1 Tax=Lepeophtheirus salmonis TaxID=72036 RepID=A0A7R8H7A3_LEPSM|nr:unnamed protein product [Lepeophtheirus salmonis]CAF2919558.1 unnamed protein product [Lepeophtheirus salmonis]